MALFACVQTPLLETLRCSKCASLQMIVCLEEHLTCKHTMRPGHAMALPLILKRGAIMFHTNRQGCQIQQGINGPI
eukprot:5169979-Amphidinium_carterae.1